MAGAQLGYGAQTSVGAYNHGCILEASRLPLRSPGLLKIFQERKRHYGNRELVDFLLRLGAAYRGQFPRPNERIQVADMASRSGGPQNPIHASHQTGLDVDLIYLRRDFRETPPLRGAKAGMDEVFVKKGEVTPNFDVERNWWLLRAAALTGRVSRIFVNESIKKHFCEYGAGLEPDREIRERTLRRLRPWPGHADHFHLRLSCPAKDANCIGQPEVPPGDGCEELTGRKQPDPEPRSALAGMPSETARKISSICRANP